MLDQNSSDHVVPRYRQWIKADIHYPKADI